MQSRRYVIRIAIAASLARLVAAPAAGAHTLRAPTARDAIERHMTLNPVETGEGERATHRRVGGCARESRHEVRCYGEFAIAVGDERQASVFCGSVYTTTYRGRSRRVAVLQETDFVCSDRARGPFTMWEPVTS